MVHFSAEFVLIGLTKLVECFFCTQTLAPTLMYNAPLAKLIAYAAFVNKA